MAMRYSQERTAARPSKVSEARQARSSVSWTASSASADRAEHPVAVARELGAVAAERSLDLGRPAAARPAGACCTSDHVGHRHPFVDALVALHGPRSPKPPGCAVGTRYAARATPWATRCRSSDDVVALVDVTADDDRDVHRDVLPEDLDASGYVGPYRFPGQLPTSHPRRHLPASWPRCASSSGWLWHDSSPIANVGWLWAAGLLTIAGVISITSGWPMHVDEREALVAAQRAVGFPVGHASAQQVWRGLRSRPTWRVLCYSVEDPPVRRGLVLVDAVDGRVVEQLVEDNPERWSASPPASASDGRG